jgi:hypothetical protein
MLLWNDSHPYNAVHAVLIPRPLDRQRLESVLKEWLERAGLTGLVVNARKGRYGYTGGPADVDLKVVEPGADARAALEAQMEAQINAPFPVSRAFTPFRFFAIPCGDAFYLGAAYCHFISDADPVVEFMSGLTEAYSLNGTCNPPPVPDLYPRAARYLLPLILRYGLRWLAGVPSFVFNISRASKPRYAAKEGRTNRLATYRLASVEFARICEAAREWGVTLNDLFLASLVKALAPMAHKRSRGRRNRIAVSSIASARRDIGPAAQGKLTPLLGSFIVFHPLPDGMPMRDIAGNVSRQTRAIKRSRGYLRTLLDMRMALPVLRKSSPERREKIYTQNYPLWGGITSVNLNRLSRDGGQRAPLDYVRAVSTGPACPLVLSITTYGEALNVTVSYRPAVFSRDEVDRIVAEFRSCAPAPS